MTHGRSLQKCPLGVLNFCKQESPCCKRNEQRMPWIKLGLCPLPFSFPAAHLITCHAVQSLSHVRPHQHHVYLCGGNFTESRFHDFPVFWWALKSGETPTQTEHIIIIIVGSCKVLFGICISYYERKVCQRGNSEDGDEEWSCYQLFARVVESWWNRESAYSKGPNRLPAFQYQARSRPMSPIDWLSIFPTSSSRPRGCVLGQWRNGE